MHPARDHLLPPDVDAYRRAEHPRGRIIVIAPTRAACETIEVALRLEVETLLLRQHGEMLASWAADGKAFGIVAGTGTGKTLGIRIIAEQILREPLRVGVVNREREATPETPSWNVVIVTTGIARRWFQDDLITGRDTLIVDEIHQTSAELELCLALGKRARCRFIWLSATVDPTFYAQYLDSDEVLMTSAFDPKLKAKVEVVQKQPEEFLDERFIRHVMKQKRGVAVFVPTRAEVEKLAIELGEQWRRLETAFYHGGMPIRIIRPFIDGEVDRPFLLAMTAAGQSALNLRGLDTVVIYDARYGNVVDRGRNVLHRMYLGANEILQMAGRVHGRVPHGEVFILSDRELEFAALKPTPPEFQLAGDAERVAITCAALGVDARDLDLPVPLDRVAYRRALQTLTSRGIVEDGRLTTYGREVEALPVERPWAELLVHADDELMPILGVCSNIESLHRMTREERDLHGVLVNGSDHLTAYNLYAEAVNQHGYVGEVYGLPRHLFDPDALGEWAERRGVLVKAIEDGALGFASVYRSLDLPLPKTLPYAGKDLRRRFQELLASYMPLDLVIDEQTADGQEVRVSKTSVAGNWGAVAGSLRFFADRFGVPRAGIEGTTLPYDMIGEHATWGAPSVSVGGRRKNQRLVVERRREYFGFQLDAEVEELRGRFPPELWEAALDALVDALLSGESAHPDQGVVRRAVGELDELWRRSGGALAAAAPDAVRARLRREVATVESWDDFLHTRVTLDVGSIVDELERDRLMDAPASVHLLGDTVPIEYEIESGEAVARIWLREGQARRLRAEEVPRLDRPVRFGVVRGPDEEPALGSTLDELRLALNRRAVRIGGGRGRTSGRGRARGARRDRSEDGGYRGRGGGSPGGGSKAGGAKSAGPNAGGRKGSGRKGGKSGGRKPGGRRGGPPRGGRRGR